MEIWRSILGFEGLYQVSNLGNVRSFKGSEKILKPAISSNGYHTVLLYKQSRKCFTVHRLVACAFLDNPENKKEINHIDGNKLNNHVDNLQWVTSSENKKHAFDTGLRCRIYDTQKHIFKNPNHGTFIGTQHDFKTKSGLHKVEVYQLIKGKRKIVKQWIYRGVAE